MSVVTSQLRVCAVQLNRRDEERHEAEDEQQAADHTGHTKQRQNGIGLASALALALALALASALALALALTLALAWRQQELTPL